MSMFDAVPMIKLEGAKAPADGTPYATHAGSITLFDRTIKCFQLNTGDRVFDADDIASLFGFDVSVPGWYWYRGNEADDWGCVQVVEHEGELMVMLDYKPYPISGGQYFGPLIDPTQQKER